MSQVCNELVLESWHERWVWTAPLASGTPRAASPKRYLEAEQTVTPRILGVYATLVALSVACAPKETVGSTHAPTPAPPSASAVSSAEPIEPDATSALYYNPVLPGTNPDPSACRVGDDYYLVTSSFEYFPGIPLYHSKDLVHWRQLGHVLTRESQLNLTNVKSSKGIYAPTLRYHDGTFYVVSTNIEGGGSFYVTAKDPAGPWSDPIWVKESVFTMDPSLFFDDDGKVYYTRHGDQRHGAIYQAEIDLRNGQLAAEPRKIWEGTGGVWPEGPHLYKVNGTYYLMISEGGTSYDHKVTVARSSSPWGPFEPNPKNPIITHRHLPEHPIQATGHADLLDTRDGHWWMVLLGIRTSSPQGAEKRYHHIGRETFLTPVTWSEEGWPVVNQGKPIELEMSGRHLPKAHEWPEPPTRDEFDSDKLAVGWSYVRNPHLNNYSLTARPGSLQLLGTTTSVRDVASPTMVLQAQKYPGVTISTELSMDAKPGQRAGLVVRGNEDNHFTFLLEGIEKEGATQRRVVLTMRVAGETQQEFYTNIQPGPIVLTIEGYPSRYEFSYQQEGSLRQAAGYGRTSPFAYEFTQSFTGAYVGLYAHSDDPRQPAIATFEYFTQRPRGVRQPLQRTLK